MACSDTSAPIATIAVTPSCAEVRVADSVQLEAQALDTRGTSIRPRAIKWSSADTSVARVNADGMVIGVGDGEVVIKATVANRAGAAAVTVTRRGVASTGDTLVLSPERVTLVAQETAQLSAGLVSVGGDTVDVTVEWTSSDERVATVDADGLVTAWQRGTATPVGSPRTVKRSAGGRGSLADSGMVTCRTRCNRCRC